MRVSILTQFSKAETRCGIADLKGGRYNGVPKPSLTKNQAECIERHGKKPHEYRLIKDLPNSMILRNIVTGETEIIEKR